MFDLLVLMEKMYKYFQLILLWSPVLLAAKQPTFFVDVLLQDMNTDVYMTDILPVMNVHLVQKQGRKLINGTFVLGQSIQKLPLRVILNFEKPDKSSFKALDLRVDACEVFNGSYSKRHVVGLALRELEKQKNFPLKCPILKNKTYGLHYFEVNTQRFPLANLKFLAMFTLYTADQKRKILDVRIKGATKRFRNYI